MDTKNPLDLINYYKSDDFKEKRACLRHFLPNGFCKKVLEMLQEEAGNEDITLSKIQNVWAGLSVDKYGVFSKLIELATPNINKLAESYADLQKFEHYVASNNLLVGKTGEIAITQ